MTKNKILKESLKTNNTLRYDKALEIVNKELDDIKLRSTIKIWSSKNNIPYASLMSHIRNHESTTKKYPRLLLKVLNAISPNKKIELEHEPVYKFSEINNDKIVK